MMSERTSESLLLLAKFVVSCEAPNSVPFDLNCTSRIAYQLSVDDIGRAIFFSRTG